jgi:hypothetical protein
MLMNSSSISSGFGFPFKDPRWMMKLSIGALLILASMILPLIPLFFVAGYCLRIIQRIILGDGQAVLPEWDDWDGLFKRGFKLSEAGLFYALPGLVLMTVGYIMIFLPYLGMSLARLASTTPQPLPPESTALMNNGAIVLGVATVLTLIGGYFSVPAAMHMATKDKLKAIFQVREWWAIMKRALGKFIGSYALIATATILLMVLFTALTATLVLCLPATILFCYASSYLSVSGSAIFASAYRAGLKINENDGG